MTSQTAEQKHAMMGGIAELTPQSGPQHPQRGEC